MKTTATERVSLLSVPPSFAPNARICAQIPAAHSRVVRARDGHGCVGIETDAVHTAAVPAQLPDNLPRSHIPEDERLVRGARRKLGVVL